MQLLDFLKLDKGDPVKRKGELKSVVHFPRRPKVDP